jgi:hypothetical protein
VFSAGVFPHLDKRSYTYSKKETFTLRHNDLDLQNNLVDDEGNITGIIDWDGCLTLPRCIGSAAVPKFLRADWFPHRNLDRSPHMTWKLRAYRTQYASYLKDCGCQDAEYTEKSALYQAAIHAITSSMDFDELIIKVLFLTCGE